MQSKHGRGEHTHSNDVIELFDDVKLLLAFVPPTCLIKGTTTRGWVTSGRLKHTSLESSPWQQILLDIVSKMYYHLSHSTLQLHPCILVAASSGLDGYIKLWDMEAGKLLKSIDGGPGEEGGLMDILLTFSPLSLSS